MYLLVKIEDQDFLESYVLMEMRLCACLQLIML